MSYQIINDIPVWGVPMQNAIDQMAEAMKHGAAGGALMADHHLGYSVPVGGVIAYRGAISPSGVGFDIACGNKAVLTDAKLSDVRCGIKTIMDDLVKVVSFGVGRCNEKPIDHSLFDDPAWVIDSIRDQKQKASRQLGTVGSGNHYVDIFHDESDRIWIGVHFGSRGFGHHIASHYIKAGGGKDGISVAPVVLDAEDNLGKEYIACMNLAGRFAYAGRDWVCQRVAELLGANIIDEVHNHHNFAWLEDQLASKEQPWGEPLWVVRKGATPAFAGQRGFVGGTMGENSVILEGVESAESHLNFHSTVHGAGRMLSRSAAAGRRKDIKKGIFKGLVTPTMMRDWVDKAKVELRGAGVDESPQCYKRLTEVLAAHNQSIKILHTLTPIGVAMAGSDIPDPWRD